jgi:hypothetical protein
LRDGHFRFRLPGRADCDSERIGAVELVAAEVLATKLSDRKHAEAGKRVGQLADCPAVERLASSQARVAARSRTLGIA